MFTQDFIPSGRLLFPVHEEKRFALTHNFCAFQSVVIGHHVWGLGRDREKKEWGDEGKRMGKSEEERHWPSNVFLNGIPSVIQCFSPMPYSFWAPLSFNRPRPNQTDNQYMVFVTFILL